MLKRGIESDVWGRSDDAVMSVCVDMARMDNSCEARTSDRRVAGTSGEKETARVDFEAGALFCSRDASKATTSRSAVRREDVEAGRAASGEADEDGTAGGTISDGSAAEVTVS